MDLSRFHSHVHGHTASPRLSLGLLSDLSGSAMTLKNHYQRKAPFLHRNWIAGVNALQTSVMGNVGSSVDPKASHHGDDDDDTPPQKRRRISSPTPANIDHLVASPRASEYRPTLRVEVLKIFHQDTKKVKSYQRTTIPGNDSTTKANCRITISDISSGRPRVLHCQSQICEVKTSPNPHGPHCIARVELPTPFYVPEESVFVNRPDDNTFDFSDSYTVSVELEPASDDRWPPLDLKDAGINSLTPSTLNADRHCTLSCEFKQLFGRLRAPLSLSQGHFPHITTRLTQYLVDVDARWTSGFQTLKRLEKGSKACITAIDPDAPTYTTDTFEPVTTDEVDNSDMTNGINGINGIDSSDDAIRVNGMNGTAGVNGIHDTNGINGFDPHLIDEAHEMHEHDDEPEGDQTPSRALRTREKNKVYNLKVLSDQAQGREKRRRARETQAAAESEGRVTYLLPSDQPVCLDYFRCVSCGAYHQSMLQLQAHLQTFHPTYEYLYETTSNGPQFRVSSRNEPFVTPTKTHSLSRPIKPFNLQSFVAGDNSWVNARLAPDSVEELPRSPRPKTLLDKLKSASPAPKAAKPSQRRSARPTPTTEDVIVPRANQPLFHPISKALLKPGDKVPKVVPDISWLIQKHRDSIDDFSDVEPAEKEYIREWDGFILQQNVTTPAYFPRAWLKFVQEKATWLVAANRRMLEFGKHTSYLLVRNVLNDQVISEAFGFINEARAKRPLKFEEEGLMGGDANAPKSPKQSPKAPQIRKTSNGCGVCHLPVLGPRLLVCSNKTCSHRLYHSDCAQASATTPIDQRKWLCSSCSRATASS
ncbi:hypothetical protein HJFPF1_07910 [Paramyrothecium foliicola]|nr:hypothetical protein HJFPF1_07910 [Paramyrothecium foliicola]